MEQARTVFEILMRAKGHEDFRRHKNGYKNPNLQVRWNYFLLGWEMRGVK